MDLGKSLKMALAKREMTQKTLAENLDVHPQQVSDWATSGKITRIRLELICMQLDMNVSEFVALGEDQ